MQKDGLKPRSVRYHHSVLHGALKTALKWGLIFRNPADPVTLPKIGRVEMQTWTEDEIGRFLEQAQKSRYYAFFYTALFTGMRRSELLGLRWSDVDLVLGQVSVSRSLQRLDRLMMNKPLADSDLVFSTADGKPWRPNTITRAWETTAAHTGVKVIRLHDARHTHATIMLKQGIHPKIVQERLGHASIEMTLDIYSHVVPGLQEAAAARFDDLVLPKRGGVEVG